MAGTGDQGGTAGRALTPQRRAVLRVVAESAEHLTANEIFEAARRELPSISFATVYNSLKYLKEAGLLREINFGKGSSLYDRDRAPRPRRLLALRQARGLRPRRDAPAHPRRRAPLALQARVHPPDARGRVPRLSGQGLTASREDFF